MKPLFKSILLTCVLGLCIFTISCGSDDDSGPSYEFIDQNLQGVIDRVSFSSNGGYFEEGFESGTLTYRIYDISESAEVCDILISESVQISFIMPDKVGLYELFFEFEEFDGLVVNLINPNGEDGIPQNNIATIGAVEILSISDVAVVGRMDATMDENNTVNGNFTVKACNVD